MASATDSSMILISFSVVSSDRTFCITVAPSHRSACAGELEPNMYSSLAVNECMLRLSDHFNGRTVRSSVCSCVANEMLERRRSRPSSIHSRTI